MSAQAIEGIKASRLAYHIDAKELECIRCITTIAGVDIGEPMSFIEADEGRGNPLFILVDAKIKGYKDNCATCLLAFEARLRGYNVEALPNTPGSAAERLSLDPARAYIDTNTGGYPRHIIYTGGDTLGEREHFMRANTRVGRRYALVVRNSRGSLSLSYRDITQEGVALCKYIKVRL